VLIPLIFYGSVAQRTAVDVALGAPSAASAPAPPASSCARRESPDRNGQQRTPYPTKIPEKVKIVQEEEAPPTTAGVMGGVPGGVPGGSMGGVIGGIIGTSTAAVPKVAVSKMRVSSGVSAAC